MKNLERAIHEMAAAAELRRAERLVRALKREAEDLDVSQEGSGVVLTGPGIRRRRKLVPALRFLADLVR